MAKQVQSGSVQVKLSKPLKIDGAEVGVLTMREPTVADQLAAGKVTKDEAEAEMIMMANLCMVTVDDLKAMTVRDYRRMQAALVGFID
jgi:hypothetical protein